PLYDDPTPTLVKYTKLSQIFRPVMNFIGVTPGYQEYDVNTFFLIFFSIFFAMLIGDGGYGIVMLIITYLFKKLYDGISKEITLLMYLLSITTTFWGAVTGQWFGMETISQLPVFRKMIIPPLYSYAQGSEAAIIHLCFFIGAVQLSFAHIWTATRIYPSLKSLSEIGWAAIVWGIYYIARFLILNDTMSTLGLSLLVIGVIMTVLFGEQRKDGILKGILHGLAKFPLNALTGIGSFSDLISYVRLFAVGLATKEVAVAFNKMAQNLGFNDALSFLGAALILIFGHSINLLLGAMAVLVHGVRLNLLECSRHLNIQWSGIPYHPLKIKRPKDFLYFDNHHAFSSEKSALNC
ncbi:MAG: V-type ATP synthase subunit I, partial [Thermodesulfobacteriota bacterium]|nr:V-type ATP synthase subunit I [Thermodesulfobacteriota bacterium]